MPLSDQAPNDTSDFSNFENDGLQNLVTDDGGTSSDRSYLGIPGDPDEYFGRLDLSYDLSADPASGSQSSRSWDRISGTSYDISSSPQYPSQDPIYGHLSDTEWEPLFASAGAPQITLTSPPTHFVTATASTSGASGSFNPSHEAWTLGPVPYSQLPTGSSSPTISTPNTSSPGPEACYDSRFKGYTDVAQNVAQSHAFGEAQDASLAFAGQSFAHPLSSVGTFDRIHYGDGALEQLSLSDMQSHSTQAVIQPFNFTHDSSSISQHSMKPLKTNMHRSRAGKSQRRIGIRQNTRKGGSPSGKRDNLEDINSVRSVGACLRCRVLHEHCDCNNPCKTCEFNRGHAKIWTYPCMRVRLSDAMTHRTCALSFPTGFDKLHWISDEKVTLSLYNPGFATANEAFTSRPSLQVICRQFHQDRHPLKKSWISNGKRVDLQLPAYAIDTSQNEDLNYQFDALMRANHDTLLLELGNGQDSLIAMTLAEAARHAGQCDALHQALMIAVMTRLSMISFNIKGPQTLGIGQVEDSESPYYGRTPIPPVLDAQLDALWMGKMNGLRKSALSNLNKMIMDKNKGREHWYMIFLTIWVLLSNLELLYQNQYQESERYGTTHNRQDAMMDSWKYAAEILNAHFHVICHGGVPLTMEWDQEAQQAGNLDAQSLGFLAALKRLAASRVEELRKRAEGPSHVPLVWISTLFLGKDWT